MTGGERRRHWSQDERARILSEIAEPGAMVAEVARRADVCTSLVYKWRREALKWQETPGLRICASGDRGVAFAAGDDAGEPPQSS